MKQTIVIKIDVTKIDKARLYKGEKGTYLDAVLMYDSDSDKYGQNGMIVQSVSKEERESGVKGAILGNAKILGQQAAQVAPQSTPVPHDQDDGLPF